MGVCSSFGNLGPETGAVFYERLWKGGGTRRGVIFCHGYGNYSYEYVFFPDPLMTALVEAGFPCIATELGGAAEWGASTDSLMTNALAQLEAIGASSEPPLVVSYSMGNLAAFNWLAHGNPVAAIVAEAPLVNFSEFYENNVAGYQSSIQAAYGSGAAVTAALPTRDPNLQAAAIANSDSPVKLYYGDTNGTSDGTIPIADVVAFAAAIDASAENIGAVSHANVPSEMPVGDAFDFLTAHA